MYVISTHIERTKGTIVHTKVKEYQLPQGRKKKNTNTYFE